ncbi:hypothetical protein BH10ACI4_BH10ACI4_25060 [soil metagenome]
MNKILSCILLTCITVFGAAQSSTQIYTGTIKDLKGATVTSGRITFTLTPSTDITVSGTARFTPSTVSCLINATGNPVATNGSSACGIIPNLSISPSGTSYRVCIQPYNTTPGSCFYDYALGGTKDISTIAPTLSTGPVNYSGIPGPPGPTACVIGSTCTDVLTPKSVGGVLYAEEFDGADISAKIDAAFVSCGVLKSCTVQLNPGQVYTTATSFTVPFLGDQGFPILDCMGSTIHYTGSSYAATAAGGIAYPGKSGLMKDCNFTGTSSALGAIYQPSRIGMDYERVMVSDFTGTNAAALFMPDTAFYSSSPGVGWTERGYVDMTSNNNTFGIRMLGNQGGTNSFGYNTVDLKGNANDGQWLMSVEGTGAFQTADLYSSTISVKGNTSGTGGGFRAILGATVRQGFLTVNVEGAGGSTGPAVAVDATIGSNAPSSIYMCGNVFGGGLSNSNPNAGGASQLYVGANACSGVSSIWQYPAYSLGTLQNRNSMWKMDAQHMAYFMACDSGAASFGDFQLTTRNTSDVPGVDASANTASGLTNIFWARACNKILGIGPGYGTNTGGKQPVLGGAVPDNGGIETTGRLSTTSVTPIGLDNGSYDIRYTDTANGNHIDYYVGGTAAAAPSFHHIEKFYDYGTFSVTNGMDCYALNGAVPCSFSGSISAPSIAPANGYTGSKTAGTCVFTIVSGIITGVTGC